MTPGSDVSQNNGDAYRLDFDAIIIGAGISGMYQLYRLRELGLRVCVLEAGTGVGGTWYWNRYPGARFDSESWSYGYSFSQELLDDWDWGEHFSGQPEIERYCNLVADRFDLRRDIRFSSRVTSAVFDEDASAWTVALDDGEQFRARFLVTAIGLLSAPTMPRFEGIEDFAGQWSHTGLWPKSGIDIRGVGNQSLKEKWRSGPRTFIGVMVDGFPNMFMVLGPHAALGNNPRSIEYSVEWISDLIGHASARRLVRAEARSESVDEWAAFVHEKAEGLLSNEVDSWMTGVNMNVAGKQTRTIVRYSGTAPEYRARCDDVAAGGYREIAFGPETRNL